MPLIVNYWDDAFRRRVAGTAAGLPRSYVCVDTETTGYSVSQDVVTEWGHVLVEDGVVTDTLSLVFDWTGRTGAGEPPDYWVRTRLDQVAYRMQLAGKRSHMSYERMAREGVRPEEGYAFVRDFVAGCNARKLPFVLHGGGFDEKMLAAGALQLKLGGGFTFGDLYLDTEAIEKASQLADNPRCHPRPGDTARDYFNRVKYTRVTGVKSNLDDHCFTKYAFAAKGVERAQMHAAAADSFCCHLLVEAFRAELTDPQPPPVYPSEQTKVVRRGSPASPPSSSPPARPAGSRVRGVRNT